MKKTFLGPRHPQGGPPLGRVQARADRLRHQEDADHGRHRGRQGRVDGRDHRRYGRKREEKTEKPVFFSSRCRRRPRKKKTHLLSFLKNPKRNHRGARQGRRERHHPVDRRRLVQQAVDFQLLPSFIDNSQREVEERVEPEERRERGERVLVALPFYFFFSCCLSPCNRKTFSFFKNKSGFLSQ